MIHIPTTMTSILRQGGSSIVRSMATAANAALGKGFVEMREYVLKPEGIKDFVKLTHDKVDLRKQLLPFLG